MLKTTSFTNLSTILQSLIDATDKDEIDEGESDSNETNLVNSFKSKRSTGTGYLTFGGIKKGGNNLQRGGGNTKKCIKAAGGSKYLTPNIKKAFNYI